MQRREFLTHTSGLLSLAALAQLVESCSKNAVSPKPAANFTIDLTTTANSALKTVGGFILSQGIYIIRTGQSTYIGLSSICTHAGCQVNYSSSSKEFSCPCHGGLYDSTGKVIGGPPPSPLAQYQVVLSGTTLTVTG